ncbi:hypothetical protein SPI_00266 [Niveomyces insectorum RCEF 264]|uniref:Ubiquitin carrier protein n=1 Tax=Niveomyces insectorum RCEF 264 TaxID=1081102 RepID=A0A167ZZL7_9HYPO|nr:hypothetical protein SPI_00266 [Niveomyces insectorum RCEF 264]
MWSHVASAGVSVLKRAVDDGSDGPQGPNTKLPPLAWALIFLVTLLFLPAFFVTSYTLKQVYPTLAIIENPNPAVYEAVNADDNDAAPAPAYDGADAAHAGSDAAATAATSKPVTASFRRTHRVLRAASGWRGSFRGVGLAIIIAVASGVVSVVFSVLPFVPTFVGSLLTMLALVQLHTAWVHAVIRATPSTLPFRQSLPPFRRTFEATCVPVFLLWLANGVTALAAFGIAKAVGLPQWRDHVSQPGDLAGYSAGELIWKTIVVVLVAIVLVFLIVIPANVVLVRVQASLLPADVDTVVPFDRSFNGTVEPAVVDSRGYVTVRDAFRTFTRASWKRLLVLYVKAYLVTIVVDVVYAAILIPIVVFTSKKTTPVV